MNNVPFPQQEFSEVGAVLTRSAGNHSNLFAHETNDPLPLFAQQIGSHVYTYAVPDGKREPTAILDLRRPLHIVADVITRYRPV